jgi:CheY-like chemotaxis protein
MRILVVEDDQHKTEQLLEFLKTAYPDCQAVVAASVRSAIEQTEGQNFDLVILDMSLPTFDMGPSESGGRPQGFGGIELMRHLEREEREMPVVVVTQWERFGKKPNKIGLPELGRRLSEEHPGMFRGLVYFSSSHEGWKEQLHGCLRRAVGGQK